MMLRLAAYADYNNIASIHSDSWIKNYSKDLNSSYLQRDCRRDRLEFWNHRLSSPKKNQRVIIAEHDNAIVGFACVHIDECSIWGAYLDNLHVVEDYQARGVGKALLKEVFYLCNTEAPSMGLYLHVNRSNKKAQSFYLKHGALKHDTSTWTAPDGSSVPSYLFVWCKLSSFSSQA